MAAISGVNGSVTFAAGYTTLADSWIMIVGAAPQDVTPLNPASDHQQLMDTGLLRGAYGNYTCKYEVDADVGIANPPYDTLTTEEWTFQAVCEAREITPLAASWRTYIAGLKSGGFDCVSYIDDGEALPTAGNTGVVTLRMTAALSYQVPYIVLEASSGVAAADIMRRVNLSCAADSVPTVSEGLPYVGNEGAATFVAEGARQYTCDILVVGITASMNRAASIGGISVDFVVNGALTGA